MENNRNHAEGQLQDYLDWCKYIANYTDQTMTCKESTCRNFIRKMKIDNINEMTEDTVNLWIRNKLSGANGFNRVSVNGLISEKIQLMAFLKWIHNTQGGTKIRFPFVAKPKPEPVNRKFYSEDQIKDILNNCDNLFIKLVISLTFDTGLRKSEVANIRKSDIRENRIRTIGKGRKLGFVYFSEKTAQLIEEFSKTKECGDNFLFADREFLLRFPEIMVRRVKLEFKRQGFPNFTFHELRHSFATDLQKKGARIDEIQKLMRHGDPAVTNRYLHGLDGILGDVWAKYKS